MAIQETWERTAQRFGWRYSHEHGGWRKNETSTPGSAIQVQTARHAVEISLSWEREARELRRRKVPLFHWGQDIGAILESIPYPC